MALRELIDRERSRNRACVANMIRYEEMARHLKWLGMTFYVTAEFDPSCSLKLLIVVSGGRVFYPSHQGPRK